eukprot:COSAG04_NODE_9460_length_862_cov_1.045872_2_plen_61_part_00
MRPALAQAALLLPVGVPLLLALLGAPLVSALDANCSCSEFCAGTCAATNAGVPEQLVMYR